MLELFRSNQNKELDVSGGEYFDWYYVRNPTSKAVVCDLPRIRSRAGGSVCDNPLPAKAIQVARLALERVTGRAVPLGTFMATLARPLLFPAWMCEECYRSALVME
jgi:hypothetical protein